MSDELDLRAIRAFVAVVDTGDFTAAARSLRVTRSAVGKALTRLEAALGVRLLHRTTRRVSPTPDGSVFHERSVRLLADLAEAQDAVRQRRQDPRGTLKLTVPDAYGRWRIQPILLDYMRRWPSVAVEVSFTDRLDHVVEEGLDLAIRIGAADASAGLVTRVIDRISGVLCAAPDYLAAREAPVGARDLPGHDLLAFGHRDRSIRWPRGTKPRQPPRMVLDSAEALRTVALAGFGVAFLPDFLVASDLAAGRLVALQTEMAEAMDVHALYPDRRLLPARVRLFIDMVVAGLR